MARGPNPSILLQSSAVSDAKLYPICNPTPDNECGEVTSERKAKSYSTLSHKNRQLDISSPSPTQGVPKVCQHQLTADAH